MPKSLEEMKTALEAVEGGSDIYTSVLELVDAEKTRGIKAKNAANNEAKNLRDQMKALEPFKNAFSELGFDPDEHDDVITFVSSLKGKLETPPNNGGGGGDGGGNGQPTKEMIELQKQMKKMQKQLEETTTNFTAEKEKNDSLIKAQNNRKMTDVLLGKFKNDKGDFKIHAPDLVVKNLIADGQVKLNDDGNVIFAGPDDDELSIDEGIEKFLGERKDLLRNTQNGGSGSSGSDGGGYDANDPQARLKRLRAAQKGVSVL